MKSILKKFFGVIIILFIMMVVLVKFSFFTTESGYIYHFQNLLAESIEVYDEPGFHFKIPFSFRVTRYAQVWTVAFGSPYGGIQIRQKGAITLRFADTYTAKIPATFRYKLPRNKEKIKMVHRDLSLLAVVKNKKIIGVVRTVDVFQEIADLLL